MIAFLSSASVCLGTPWFVLGVKLCSRAALVCNAIRVVQLAIAHSNRGLTLHDLGRHDEALAAFNRAIALKPDVSARACCVLALVPSAAQSWLCMEGW